MNWSDYLVIGLIASFAIVGLFRGFIMSVYKLIAFFVCIFVSYKFSPVLARVLEKTPVYGGIRDAIAKNLPLVGEKAVSASSTAPAGSAGAESMLGTLPLPEFFRKSLLGNLPTASELLNTDAIVNAVGDELARMIISVLSLVVLYFVLRVIAAFVGLLLKGISELPLFKQVNRLGGFILGCVQGVLAIYILCAILVLFNSNPQFAPIYDGLDTSLFAGGFYENNFIINWMFPPVTG